MKTIEAAFLAIKRSSREAESIQELATAMDMPRDPVGWLADAKTTVSGLSDKTELLCPDEKPDELVRAKFYILGLIETAEERLNDNDELRFKTLLIQIQESWESAKRMAAVIYKKSRGEQSRNAASEGGKKESAAKKTNLKFVQRMHKERAVDGKTLKEWCETYKIFTGESIHPQTMALYLTELGYSYKGKRKKKSPKTK